MNITLNLEHLQKHLACWISHGASGRIHKNLASQWFFKEEGKIVRTENFSINKFTEKLMLTWDIWNELISRKSCSNRISKEERIGLNFGDYSPQLLNLVLNETIFIFEVIFGQCWKFSNKIIYWMDFEWTVILNIIFYTAILNVIYIYTYNKINWIVEF